MKQKALYQITKKVLYPCLEPLNFENHNGRYVRELDTGVLHIMGIAHDPHGQRTFRFMCGVDAMQINDSLDKFHAGFIKRYPHLTKDGWYYNSGRWPCETEEEALESLGKVKELVLELALPWFDAHQTLSSVADEIYDDAQSVYKAKLYMLDGDKEKAEQTIKVYLDWINARRTYYVEPKWREERIAEALAFLEEIKTT